MQILSKRTRSLQKNLHSLEKELQSIYSAKLKIEEKTSTKENSRIDN